MKNMSKSVNERVSDLLKYQELWSKVDNLQCVSRRHVGLLYWEEFMTVKDWMLLRKTRGKVGVTRVGKNLRSDGQEPLVDCDSVFDLFRLVYSVSGSDFVRVFCQKGKKHGFHKFERFRHPGVFPDQSPQNESERDQGDNDNGENEEQEVPDPGHNFDQDQDVVMADHPGVVFRTDLLDCHVDICSPELLLQFSDNFDYQVCSNYFICFSDLISICQIIRKHFIKNEVVNWDLGMHIYGYILNV